MITSVFSGIDVVVLLGFAGLIVVAYLVWYALRMKGDVVAELTHGKTSLRLGVREKSRCNRQSPKTRTRIANGQLSSPRAKD